MSLSFRYWINPSYPSVSTEDPTPDYSISTKSRSSGSRIRNCLKKVKQLVSTRSSFVASLFRRGKATKFVSPAGETDEFSKGPASSESVAVKTETQRFSFEFVPAAESEEHFSSPLGYDVVSSSSDSSSAADEDSTHLSLPLASLFFFEDMNSPSGVEIPRRGGTEKTVRRFTVTPPGWAGDSASLGHEFPPAKKKPVEQEEDCKTEQRVGENASMEEETEFFKYYINKVYKEPEALMAAFPDGRLAEWNRILASAKKIEEMQTRRRDYRYGGRGTSYSFCFSLHVRE